MLDNTALIESSNYWFALLALAGFIFAAGWIIDLLTMRFWKPGIRKTYHGLVQKLALPFGFFISLLAVAGSLYYEFYLHIQPCHLCWMARIFIYPLLFIFGMAWYKNDRRIFDYVMLLSGIGFLIAVYHHYLQMGYNLLAPCSTAPFAVDCSTPTFIEFGFVTYPLMGAVTLALTFLTAYSAKRFHN